MPIFVEANKDNRTQKVHVSKWLKIALNRIVGISSHSEEIFYDEMFAN